MATPIELVKKKKAASIHKILEKRLSGHRVYVGMATCEIALWLR